MWSFYFFVTVEPEITKPSIPYNNNNNPSQGQGQPPPTQTYDVIVARRENEGFGFIIVSSVNRVGAVLGEFCIGTYQPKSHMMQCIEPNSQWFTGF